MDRIGKQQMLQQLADMYRACNLADSDSSDRSAWMVPEMAGRAGCNPIEKLVRAMLTAGSITQAEYDSFFSCCCGEIDRVVAL